MSADKDRPTTADFAGAGDRGDEMRGVSGDEMRGVSIESAKGHAESPVAEVAPVARDTASSEQTAAARPRKTLPPSSSDKEPSAALFTDDELTRFRQRWNDIQTSFVDEPRRVVHDADVLVAEVTTRLAEGFAKERTALEQQWDGGDRVTTENLRLVLRRYRAFFERLLSM